jgi:hypothetical protein
MHAAAERRSHKSFTGGNSKATFSGPSEHLFYYYYPAHVPADAIRVTGGKLATIIRIYKNLTQITASLLSLAKPIFPDA